MGLSRFSTAAAGRLPVRHPKTCSLCNNSAGTHVTAHARNCKCARPYSQQARKTPGDPSAHLIARICCWLRGCVAAERSPQFVHFVSKEKPRRRSGMEMGAQSVIKQLCLCCCMMTVLLLACVLQAELASHLSQKVVCPPPPSPPKQPAGTVRLAVSILRGGRRGPWERSAR